MGTRKVTSSAKAPSAQVSAAQLRQLQDRLNTDTRLRNQFLKSPGTVLRREGVELLPEQEQKLAQFTSEISGPDRQFFGAEVKRATGPAAARLRIRVTIIIRIGIAF